MENQAGQPHQGEGPLGGAVALITGGSRGIGLAIARRLGALGARLALCSRGAEHLQSRCEGSGRQWPGSLSCRGRCHAGG